MEGAVIIHEKGLSFDLYDLQCQHVRLVRIQAPLTFLIFTQDSWHSNITLIFL